MTTGPPEHPDEKIQHVNETEPQVRIYIQPLAPPGALGLAGFASSTFIVSSWIANWWGNSDSPPQFFPFVMLWGGLAQFIAGFMGFPARDVSVTVINTMWGAFWMSIGFQFLLNTTGVLPSKSVHEHYPELASWFVVLSAFTWVGAIAATARDIILAGVLYFLALGATIACCLFAYGNGVNIGMKVAAYLWLVSALLAWLRVSVYLLEEAYGPESRFAMFSPTFKTKVENRREVIVPGLGQFGLKGEVGSGL